MATAPVQNDDVIIHVDSRRRLIILGAIMLSLFLGALDQTVVGTALPRIVTDLHGDAYYTWVVTLYLLTSTITVPMYGKLQDVYGGKLILSIGIIVFLLGSALSGLSQTMWQLILFRGLQGIGAGALFPVSLAIIGDLFTPAERGKYQGLFGAVFGLSFIVGPFIGGAITDSIGWHWVFYVNVPIGILALFAIEALLPNVHIAKGNAREFDYLGSFVFMASIVPILIGLTNKGLTNAQGNLYPWSDWRVGGLILLGLVLFLVFLFVESKAKEPIVPLHHFRMRTFTAVIIATMIVSLTMFSAVIFLPRYYQAVRGISATASGYEMWPLLLGLIATSILAGFLVSIFGKYRNIIIGSYVVLIIGSFLAGQFSLASTDVEIWAWIFIIGVGIGPSMSVSTVIAQNLVPPSEIGVATSTLTFFRQVGGSIGLAIAGTVFASSFTSLLPGQLAKHHLPLQLQAHVAHSLSAASGNVTAVGNLAQQLAASLPTQLHPYIPDMVGAIHGAFTRAVGTIFFDSALIAIAALLASLFIKDVPLRGFRKKASAEHADDGAEEIIPEPIVPAL